MVDIVQADRDELGYAGDGSAETGFAGNGRQRGGVDRPQLLQRLRRISGAVEVLHMGREIAKLAGFIDQAGLFRTLGPVTNKLHFSALLVGFVFTCRLIGTARAGLQCPSPDAAATQHTLILRRPRSGRLEGRAAGEIGASWFETPLRAPHHEGRGHSAINLKASPSRLIWPALK